jgi:TetR/AcrR family transcriptional repressor of nem operon
MLDMTARSGRLALEVDPENRPSHRFIAENLRARIDAVRDCLQDAKLPAGTDIEAVATWVLATMEGGVMLSGSYGSVDPIDRTVKALRDHFAPC